MDMDAQELYWEGVKAFGEQLETREAFKQSRDSFAAAIAADKTFARAHGWLAYVIAQGWYHGFYDERDEKDALESAKAHALKSVDLDDYDYENHWSLAEVQHRIGDMERAYNAFRTAMQLNDNDAILLANWADVLNKRGEGAEALKSIDEAIASIPGNAPDYFYWNKAYILYFMKQHNASLTTLRNMKGRPTWSSYLFAANHAWLGQSGDTKKEMKVFRDATPDTEAWTIEKELKFEASSFSRDEDKFYWLQGLNKAELPSGKLPNDVAEKLK